MCDVYMGSWMESWRKNGYMMEFYVEFKCDHFQPYQVYIYIYKKKKLKHDGVG